MKRGEKAALFALCVLALACVITAASGNPSRWITSAGLMLDMAGVVQLEIAGLFELIAAELFDEKKYPYGPPSHITRRIIDNPDTPIRTAIRNTLFCNARTGFWLLGGGFMLQLVGAWL